MKRIICWLLRRQILYGQWLADVDKVIIAVLKSEKAHREERRKAHKATHGFDYVHEAKVNCILDTAKRA